MREVLQSGFRPEGKYMLKIKKSARCFSGGHRVYNCLEMKQLSKDVKIIP